MWDNKLRETMQKGVGQLVPDLRAVVAVGQVQHNPYFNRVAAQLFAETIYLAVRPDRTQVAQLLSEFDVVIVGAREKIRADMLNSQTRVSLVGSLSIGLDHLDVQALHARGISVLNSPMANVRSVAEHNVALVFALSKRLKEGDLVVRRGGGRDDLAVLPAELAGKTVGIIGYGKIGQATARMLAAFGMNIVATSVTRRAGRDDIAKFAELSELLGTAHIVILSVPYNDGTRHLLNTDAIRSMRPGAILINTCRPDIVDHVYVAKCLANGQLAGFGGDYDHDYASLTSLPNAVLTPHVAGLTVEADSRIDNELIDRIQTHLDSGV